ncbi:MAG: hypothetical protein PQJ44_00475 [Sphaerochaetaceae bacterium]|nr:hypothetical protein [Sphaerochaetaceae bacterium]
MFKNKHVIAAVIIAPILAIIAWFATGMLVDEKPHKMQEGSIYTLNVKSNCRWPSGKCTLENEDITIDITGNYTSYTLELAMKSSVMFSDVKIAYDKKNKPQAMAYDKSKELWLGILDLKNKSNFINIVYIIDSTVFYAQIPTTFLEPKETKFDFEKDK